jgi:hypothetical protein
VSVQRGLGAHDFVRLAVQAPTSSPAGTPSAAAHAAPSTHSQAHAVRPGAIVVVPRPPSRTEEQQAPLVVRGGVLEIHSVGKSEDIDIKENKLRMNDANLITFAYERGNKTIKIKSKHNELLTHHEKSTESTKK